jgi:hypothetical protein
MKSLRPVWCILSLLLLPFALLSGSEQTSLDQNEDNVSTYINLEHEIGFQYPNGCKQIAGWGLPGVIFYAIHPGITEEVKPVATIAVFSQEMAETDSLDQLYQAALNETIIVKDSSLQWSFKTEINDSGYIEVNGLSGFWILSSVISGEPEEENIAGRALTYVFVKGNKQYGLALTAPTDLWTSYEPQFKRIASSFTHVPNIVNSN